MSIIHRTAQPDDLNGLLALYRELRPQDAPLRTDDARRTLQRLLDDPAIRLVVAADEEQPIATCMLALIGAGAPGAAVRRHRARSDGRALSRHGVALAMIEYALQLARRKGCYKVMLLSGQQRTGAHQLYLKAGFDGDRERGFVIRRPEGR